MLNPLVSVLIPCYNVEKYVVESISSILNQTYTNLEVIAINDCSTDSTKEKLEYLAKQDNRIKVYNNDENFKLIKTLNKGIGLCTGEYIARMDADDISLPTRIEKQVYFLNTYQGYDIVSTMFYTFRSGSRKKNLYQNPILFEDLQAYLLFKNGICHPAAMIRKTLFIDKKLRFEEEYMHVEDYALWSKTLYCSRLANLDEPLLYYRVHKQQVSSLNNQFQLDNKKEVFKIHCEKLNLPTTSVFLDIYTSVAECVPKYSSIDFIKSCEAFMVMLIEKNHKENFCSQKYLRRMLSLHWLRLCANSKLGFKISNICRKSTLYCGKEYRYSDHLIFFTKCLFRLEYKKSFFYKIVFR